MFKIRSQSSIEELRAPTQGYQDPMEQRRALKLQPGNHVQAVDGTVYVLTQVGMKFAKGYKLNGDKDLIFTVRNNEVNKIQKSRAEVVAELEGGL